MFQTKLFRPMLVMWGSIRQHESPFKLFPTKSNKIFSISSKTVAITAQYNYFNLPRNSCSRKVCARIVLLLAWRGYTPTTSSKMSSQGVGRSLLVVYLFYLSTICPSGPPWNEGHRPNGSSRDQCLWDPLKQERHKYRFYWYYMCLLH